MRHLGKQKIVKNVFAFTFLKFDHFFLPKLQQFMLSFCGDFNALLCPFLSYSLDFVFTRKNLVKRGALGLLEN